MFEKFPLALFLLHFCTSLVPVAANFCDSHQCVILRSIGEVENACPYKCMRLRSPNTTTIEVAAFRTCTGTESLDLSSNNIRQINVGAFLGLDNLIILIISNNKIKEIESGTFHTLHILEYLYIDSNLIKMVPEYEFGSDKIKVFRSENNKIKELKATALEKLTNVTVLDLSNNRLKSIPRNAFFYIQPGLHLRLSNNRLSNAAFDFDDNFSNATSKLFLSGNRFTSLDADTFGEFYKMNLVSLDLSYNYIEFIEPGTFHQFNLLENLYLSNNKLENINNNIFAKLTGLKKVDLSSNRFGNFIFNIDLPQSVKSISLANNQIDSLIRMKCAGLDKTKDLINLDHNKLTYFKYTQLCKDFKAVSINYNDLNCGVLHEIVSNLQEEAGIQVVAGNSNDKYNVDGIECRMEWK